MKKCGSVGQPVLFGSRFQTEKVKVLEAFCRDDHCCCCCRFRLRFRRRRPSTVSAAVVMTAVVVVVVVMMTSCKGEMNERERER